jgi:hypothetical protein
LEGGEPRIAVAPRSQNRTEQLRKLGNVLFLPRLRTIYQQQLCYIQAHDINCSPVELFDRDLAKQIKEWRKSGKRIVLVMDVNDHPLTSKFYQQLQKEQTGLEEFTHKC